MPWVSLAACGLNDHGKDVMSSALHPKFRATFPVRSLEVLLGMTSTLKLLPHPFCCTLILNPYQINYTSANCLPNTLFSGTQPVKVLTERKRKRKRKGKENISITFTLSKTKLLLLKRMHRVVKIRCCWV